MARQNSINYIVEFVMDEEAIMNINFNGDFLHNVFNNVDLEILKFVATLKLIKNNMVCDACGQQMNLILKKRSIDGYCWSCRTPCRKEMSIRHGSIFDKLKKN